MSPARKCRISSETSVQQRLRRGFSHNYRLFDPFPSSCSRDNIRPGRENFPANPGWTRGQTGKWKPEAESPPPRHKPVGKPPSAAANGVWQRAPNPLRTRPTRVHGVVSGGPLSHSSAGRCPAGGRRCPAGRPTHQVPGGKRPTSLSPNSTQGFSVEIGRAHV